ncbi:TTF-type domain-containing protein [Citrus sinensis]|uniref:TTF-type domain-containing protein n=1 Tax=Citrus sinensis TaxID=2711 RepID=A0ACB8JNF2_CITSI|nr:TTF-type domain-containing protein [Citrus sinensis]
MKHHNTQSIWLEPANHYIFKRDPGLCRQIWSYHVNQQDEIRRSGDHVRNFQSSWYSLFPTWLEYSIANDAAFLRGKKCAFLNHDLMNQSQHIQHVFHNYTTQDVIDNRLRLKFLIRASRYLALQGSTFRVRKTIREEIGDAKFCIIFNEARDEFVDKDGIIRERFFGLVHVSETSAQTLKKRDIFCQGYYIASDMRGEWNGLQALILKDCPCTYYIHLVILVHQFFTKLTSVVNIVRPSCKRNDELKHAKAYEIAHMLALDELETGKWLNQIGTLQRAVSSLINMFSATCQVLINIVEDGVTYASRGDADAVYGAITSFEFVFVLHLMKNIMAITDLLSQKMRDEKWQNLLENVISFCKAHNIDIPNMNAYNFAMEQHYRVNIFYAAIDSQLQELNIRFNDSSVELLMLNDFTDNEKIYLRKDIAKKISMESVIDDFRDMKERKVGF